MSGIRKIDLHCHGQQEEDGSVTLSFVLRGLASKAEADAMVKMLTEKLQRGIVKTLKRRGQKVYDSGKAVG